MITVKALVTPPQRAQTSREDFAEQEETGKRRLIPIAFLLFLTGCAVYLKSFLPIRLEAREEADDRGAAVADQGAPETDDAIGAADGEEDAPVAVKSSADAGEARISVPANVVFMGNAFRDFDFKDLARPADVRVDAGLVGEEIKPGSGNRAPAEAAPTGGGGGGGGGGGDERPRANADDPVRPPIDPPDNPGAGPPEPGTPPSDPIRNRAPRVTGPVRLQDMAGCQAFLISLLALLSGASDADGDALTVTGLSSSAGALVQTADGGWEFIRESGMTGEVKLTYTISDGQASVVQTASFSVIEAPPIIGTAGDDNLVGTHCGDTIAGGDGDDNIDGRGGADHILGGDGDDHILAGAGNDVVYAGAGNDIVFAGTGNDIVFGGSGNDRLFGEDGDDTLMGEDGDDLLSGGFGNDILLAGAGDDRVEGGDGSDTIDGGDGNDILSGGADRDVIVAGLGDDMLDGGDGDDVLSDGADADTVRGGAGDDYLIAAADGAADVYAGDTGYDTLDYSASTAGIVANMTAGTVTGADTGSDQISSIEKIIGSSGRDRIAASAQEAISIDGGAGDDNLQGGSADDVIADGSGSDTVHTREGDDHVVAAADGAADVYDGGSGQDVLDYSSATLSVTIDLRRGTADGDDIGHDLIESFEEIIGGAGDDRLVAGSGSVVMTGGRGDDTFEFKQGSDDDQSALTVRKITDFTVGDRIVAATYEISYLGEDGAEAVADLFSDIYLSGEADHSPIRFRFEHRDTDGDVTFVDIRDRPDAEDFYSIEVSGHHLFQFTVGIV